jgi:NADP-dependent 3-hydroxy acid dehydrogenase YdfG
MINLKNKVVLITGASSGIGYELSKQLAKENCRLALLARRKNIIDELAQKINDSGGTAVSIECDVSSKLEIESAIKKLKKPRRN